MKRRGAVVLGALAVVGAVLLGPFVLRAVPFFRVRRVEVVGARYLAPERILAAAELAPDQNLFDPTDAAARRVAEVPGVVRARIERRVPGTLRVRVVEREPAGLVPGREGMTVVDCDAQTLPYDPARAGLALPIVERADTALTRALCLVRAGDAQLYETVDAVRRGSGGSVMLEAGRQRIWLTRTPTLADVHAVAMVRRHLEAMGRGAAELDARYRGLVYARRERT
ncbi:MAG: FtsQ-type POTRA domain-containing protein [Gemmatimonadota bacterium]|nr:FtsQ-type POTRA domain-containing protein [Gemmatimonadota bacterium]